MSRKRISNYRLLEEIEDVMLRVIRLETDVRNRYEKIIARIGAQELKLATLSSSRQRVVINGHPDFDCWLTRKPKKILKKRRGAGPR